MSTVANQIVVDEAVVQVLRQAKGPTQIRDDKGNLCGVFTPAEVADVGFDLDRARETLRREYDTGRPLKEVWERIQARSDRE